jgi:hypothetical protein
MYLPELNGIIRDAAAAYGFAVANVELAFAGNEADLIYVNRGIYSNPLLRIPFTPWFESNVDFHPRPAGHQVIADEFWAALGIVPNVPALLDLPDLIPSNVALVLPWTCGDCAVAGRQQAALAALPEPTTINIEWLGAQLWNRITRPLVCWLLAITQAVLNLYAATLNQLWIPALNTFFRLIYALFFWLTSAYATGWQLGEDMRSILWQINGHMATLALGAVSTVATDADLANAVLRAWVSVFTGALYPWTYFIRIYVSSASQILDIFTHLSDHIPDQLAAVAGVWLFAALKGVLRGFYESQLGWWLTAQIGLFALATGLYVLDEAAEV